MGGSRARQQRRQSAVEQRGGRQAMGRCHRVCSDAAGHVRSARMREGLPVKALETSSQARLLPSDACRPAKLPSQPPGAPAQYWMPACS